MNPLTLTLPCPEDGTFTTTPDHVSIWIPELGLPYWTAWHDTCGHPHHGPVTGDTITRLQPARGVIRETRLDRCLELVDPHRLDNRDHSNLLTAQARFWATRGRVEIEATDEARRWATALLLALKAQEAGK